MNPNPSAGDLPAGAGYPLPPAFGMSINFDPVHGLAPIMQPTSTAPYHIPPGYPMYIAPPWAPRFVDAPNELPQPLSNTVSPTSSDDSENRPVSEGSTPGLTSSSAAQRTLFIAGFPADVKEREIFNLLRFQPGFIDCSLTPSSNGKQVRRYESGSEWPWRGRRIAQIGLVEKVQKVLVHRGSLLALQPPLMIAFCLDTPYLMLEALDSRPNPSHPPLEGPLQASRRTSSFGSPLQNSLPPVLVVQSRFPGRLLLLYLSLRLLPGLGTLYMPFSLRSGPLAKDKDQIYAKTLHSTRVDSTVAILNPN